MVGRATASDDDHLVFIIGFLVIAILALWVARTTPRLEKRCCVARSAAVGANKRHLEANSAFPSFKANAVSPSSQVEDLVVYDLAINRRKGKSIRPPLPFRKILRGRHVGCQ
jgi:hypothetical protein